MTHSGHSYNDFVSLTDAMGEDERSSAIYDFPEYQLKLERHIRASIAAKLLFGLSAFAVCLILLFWFVEYALTSINFAHWVSERWYVIVFFAAMTIWGHVSNSGKASDAIETLGSISSSLDDPQVFGGRAIYKTGGIQMDRTMVGPVTVSVSFHGLVIWRNGEPIAYFPWVRVLAISRPIKSNQGDKVIVKINRKSPMLPLEFLMPWAAEMENEVRVSNQ